MRLIGFNFDKISIERTSDSFKGLNIDTKIDVSEIKDSESNLLKIEGELITVKFKYSVEYEPKIAKLELGGNIILKTDKDEKEDIMKQWKDKKMPEDFKITLFNIILRKSNIKALELEDELNLPLHIPLPNLKKQEEGESK